MKHTTLMFLVNQRNSVLGTISRCCLPAYDPFGYAGTSALHLAQFNGNLLELATQCYLLGHGYRAYSPALKRFLSPDSLSPFGRGGINTYVYCGADPVNNIDPDGHMSGTFLPKSILSAEKKRLANLGVKQALFGKKSLTNPALDTNEALQAEINKRTTQFESYLWEPTKTDSALERLPPEMQKRSLDAIHNKQKLIQHFSSPRNHPIIELTNPIIGEPSPLTVDVASEGLIAARMDMVAKKDIPRLRRLVWKSIKPGDYPGFNEARIKELIQSNKDKLKQIRDPESWIAP